MSNHLPMSSPEDAHDDLRALLAAGRELGPEMDQALVESYLQQHPAPAAAPAAPARRPARARGAPLPLYPIGFLLAAVVCIAVLVASGGHAFWLLWLPFVLGGWWWRRWTPYGHWGYHSPYPERPARRDD